MKLSTQHLALSTLVTAAMMAATPVHAQFLGQQSLSQSSYIIDKDGALWAWGWNSNGQLGIGSALDQSRPVQVAKPSGVSTWTLVAGGAQHTLAVADSMELYAWGYNADGELGDGTTTAKSTPVLIPNPTGVTGWNWVSAGQDHSMALATNGQLYAWGANASGQLGTGDTKTYKTPQLIALPRGVTSWAAIAAGPGTSYATSNAGKLYAWGLDMTFPNNKYVVNSRSPAILDSVDTLRTVAPSASLAATGGMFCAMLADPSYMLSSEKRQLAEEWKVACGGSSYMGVNGNIYAWGDTLFSQGRIWSAQHKGSHFVDVAAGLHHTIALADDGNLYAWGDNSHGQIGDGSGLTQYRPVLVAALGDTIAMHDTLPTAMWPGKPFTVSVTVTNSSLRNLSGLKAYLFCGSPLRVVGGAMGQPLKPSSLSPIQFGTATWTIDADSSKNPSGSSPVRYWVYIRANGSAPVTASGYIGIPLKRTGWAAGIVVDSTTGKPVSGVTVNISASGIQDTAMTAADGSFFRWILAAYGVTMTVATENYRTAGITTVSYWDTIHPRIALLPAPIHGSFTVQDAQSPVAFSKIFWVDSTTIYGIASSALIYRSTDRGGSWRNFVASPKGNKLRGIFFLSPKEGWVVGDLGTIEHTTDSGATWTALPNPSSFDLYGVCGVNNHLWVCGDGGVIFHYRSGKVSNESDPLMTRKLYSIYFLDTGNGVVGGQTGIFESYDTANGWNRITSGFGDDLSSVVISSPGYAYNAGANGLVSTWGTRRYLVPKHTLNELYLVTPKIGYVVGDSGSSFATYDGGNSWAQLTEMTGDVTSLNFYGADGIAFRGTTPLFFAGRPNPGTAIIHGRVTAADGMSSVSGAIVSIRSAAWRDSVYTNEVGEYVFIGVLPGKDTLVCTGSDGSGSFTRVADTVAIADAAINVDFTKYAPLPRSVFEGASLPAVALSCDPNPIASQAVLNFTLPESGAVRLSLFDMLGREVQLLTSGFELAGDHAIVLDAHVLPAGSYFAKLMTSQGSATTLIVLTR